MGATLLGVGAAQAAENPPARHQWRSRVLVISAPERNDPKLAAQRAAFEKVRDGLKERDLVTLEAVGDGAAARDLRARLKLPADAFRVVLIGKDGGTKRTEAVPLTADALFETIDAMPMRQDEKRRRNLGRGPDSTKKGPRQAAPRSGSEY
ncbi:DUF4174 domain-containing protein [Methylobacterium sp. J-068]|uniref:DUF4174 domain-containing protein n=1 Tax=Methylobacterium sp. J-068 TaxID=2836649 RepID=UPI001FB94B9F|nr:DUF4174 domain-containing protein [Methylobacterium sp. J-068]MCJ2033662.1 DUF4174 domain-containing protein [Methylobacterium sp. J-068]